MTTTRAIKDELLATRPIIVKERIAELTSILRFGGGLHVISGRIALEVEVDDVRAVQRIRKDLLEIYGVRAEAKKAPQKFQASKNPVFLIRVMPGETISRQLGLLDAQRRQIRGLPNAITTGARGELAATLRGAFLVKGVISHTGRATSLEFVCPTHESAMALSGAAGRLGISAKVKEIRAQIKVLVREDDSIHSLLLAMGAKEAAADWLELRQHREERANANRLVNFVDANLRRSAQASVNACARVERALEILGSSVPKHLKYAGELRLKNREASLNDLGAHADPPLTKDAIAGRIRRLLAMADKEAARKGIPGTEAGLPPGAL
ncbi:MAG TPA: DNA-binding protein WhiA [Microbacteriaceae bacterium]|nr:DNA-binding protein WhiA [Microbacteriaceae bacterium]